MSLLVACLYLLCIAFLFGSGLWVFSRDPYSRLNSSFAVLAFTLLGWVLTLFLFSPQTSNPALLWLGRANFAALALAAPATLQFVEALANRQVRHSLWLWSVGFFFVILSLFTSLVDKGEALRGSVHVTSYGALFPLYTLYILFCAVGALWRAFEPAPQLHTQTRVQLRFVGFGILTTTAIALVVDAILPYYYGDFGYIHVGPLSTIVFLGLVAYAVSVHHLFNVRILVRSTVVFAVLIGLFLEFYRVAVDALAHLLPLQDATERQIAATAVALIVNAFSHEALKHWLERLIDRVITGSRKSQRRP
jgi:hypothetical protein